MATAEVRERGGGVAEPLAETGGGEGDAKHASTHTHTRDSHTPLATPTSTTFHPGGSEEATAEGGGRKTLGGPASPSRPSSSRPNVTLMDVMEVAQEGDWRRRAEGALIAPPPTPPAPSFQLPRRASHC